MTILPDGLDQKEYSAISDTERLDWLQSHRKTAWSVSHESWGISTADPFTRIKTEVFDGWAVNPNDEPKRSIRAAIDAAMFPQNDLAVTRGENEPPSLAKEGS